MSNDILNLVYAAIDDVNAQAVDRPPIPKSPDARLLGRDGGIDSLSFVNLVVAIEERIQDSLGKSIVLVNEESMGQDRNPFRTVSSMVQHIQSLISPN